MAGRLYVVGTPLGNLDDLSPRAVATLRRVAVVAAEDTRSAARLFARFEIRVPLVSCFQGNEAQRADELCARIAEGDDVAYISEAGMPGVSDPGERLVAQAVARGLTVEVVPGPCAAITALVASGLASARFTFVGFLPRGGDERSAELARLRRYPETLIFYEAPGRAGATLTDLAAVLGADRRACLSRELTKLYEEHARGTLAELAARYAETPPRGEVTLVVAGAGDEAATESAIDLEAAVDRRLAAGESAKEIAAALALATGKPRRQIYQLAIARRPRPG